MKKKIKDCTFKEFTGWANARACDGRDRKSTRLNSSHSRKSRMPSSA